MDIFHDLLSLFWLLIIYVAIYVFYLHHICLTGQNTAIQNHQYYLCAQ